MKIKYVKSYAEVFPPFYYGFSYYDLLSDKNIFYIFPLNIFIKLWKAFRNIQFETWHYLSYKSKFIRLNYKSNKKIKNKEIDDYIEFLVNKLNIPLKIVYLGYKNEYGQETYDLISSKNYEKCLFYRKTKDEIFSILIAIEIGYYLNENNKNVVIY